MAINVRLKDAGGNVLHPETDWSVVLNKPTYFPTSWSDLTFNKDLCAFGLYESDRSSGGEEVTYYPAIRTVESYHFGGNFNYTYYYFAGTGWESFTDASLFHPGFTV